MRRVSRWCAQVASTAPHQEMIPEACDSRCLRRICEHIMYFVLVRPLGILVTIDLSLYRSTLAWALAVVVVFLATVVLVCAPLGLFSACDGASGCNVTRDGAASTQRRASRRE
jgi:hypothetical protein